MFREENSMKRLTALLCSLLVTVAFATVCLAEDPKVPKAPPKSKPKTAPAVPHDMKGEGSKKATAAKTEEQNKNSTDPNKGKKVEKKEEPKKGDGKK